MTSNPVELVRQELLYLAGHPSAHPGVVDAWKREYRGFQRFAAKYGKMFDKERGQTINAELYDAQLDYAEHIFRGDWTWLLKTRQIGITTVEGLICCWRLLFKKGYTISYSAQEMEYAEAFIRDKVDFVMDRLPWWMLKGRERVKADKQTRIFGEKWGSKLVALKATVKAGKSDTWNWCIINEAQDIKSGDLKDFIGAIAPALETAKGQITGSFTSEGPVGYYFDVYMLAKTGESQFVPLFYPWWSKPSRTEEWYAAETEKYKHNPYYMLRAYPASEDEAWTASTGRCLPHFSEAKHVKSLSSYGYAKLPPVWRVYRSIDFGGVDPFVCLWLVVIPGARGFSIDPQCVNTIREIKTWSYKDNGQPEDKKGCDAMDCLRNFIKLAHIDGSVHVFREIYEPESAARRITLWDLAHRIKELSSDVEKQIDFTVADCAQPSSILMLNSMGIASQASVRTTDDTSKSLIQEGIEKLNHIMAGHDAVWNVRPTQTKEETDLLMIREAQERGLAITGDDRLRLDYLKEFGGDEII